MGCRDLSYRPSLVSGVQKPSSITEIGNKNCQPLGSDDTSPNGRWLGGPQRTCQLLGSRSAARDHSFIVFGGIGSMVASAHFAASCRTLPLSRSFASSACRPHALHVSSMLCFASARGGSCGRGLRVGCAWVARRLRVGCVRLQTLQLPCFVGVFRSKQHGLRVYYQTAEGRSCQHQVGAAATTSRVPSRFAAGKCRNEAADSQQQPRDDAIAPVHSIRTHCCYGCSHESDAI